MSDDFNFQEKLDQIRNKYDFDFAGIAMALDTNLSSHIKWQYVSGNLNHRYKNIILRNGRGIAGIVIKSGKEMILHNIKDSIYNDQVFSYPIIQIEELTALIAFPLWIKNRVKGVLLLGQRNDKRLPNLEQLHFSSFGPFQREDMINS